MTETFLRPLAPHTPAAGAAAAASLRMVLLKRQFFCKEGGGGFYIKSKSEVTSALTPTRITDA